MPELTVAALMESLSKLKPETVVYLQVSEPSEELKTAGMRPFSALLAKEPQYNDPVTALWMWFHTVVELKGPADA